MNHQEDRFSTNAPGEWYVTTLCIDCGMCPEEAPSVFKRDDDTGNSYVHRQPTTEAELAEAEMARDKCPTEAICRAEPTAAG